MGAEKVGSMSGSESESESESVDLRTYTDRFNEIQHLGIILILSLHLYYSSDRRKSETIEYTLDQMQQKAMGGFMYRRGDLLWIQEQSVLLRNNSTVIVGLNY